MLAIRPAGVKRVRDVRMDISRAFGFGFARDLHKPPFYYSDYLSCQRPALQPIVVGCPFTISQSANSKFSAARCEEPFWAPVRPNSKLWATNSAYTLLLRAWLVAYLLYHSSPSTWYAFLPTSVFSLSLQGHSLLSFFSISQQHDTFLQYRGHQEHNAFIQYQ